MKLSVFLLGILYSYLVLVSVAAQDAPAEAPADAAPAEAPADAAPAEGAAPAETGCKPCPVITPQHFIAKGCTPVMNETVDKCCPSSYDCKTEEERNFALTSCLYKGTMYEVGKDVPVDGPCRRACKCKKSINPEEPAKIECSIVECPSLFSPPKPGCRNLYSIDECCEVDQECHPIVPPSEVVSPEANATIRPADCVSEGLHYFLGDKILFGSAPCQYCVCTKEFTGAFGPGCTKVDCGMEYRNRHYLRLGCIPLYLSASCCNVDWICPGSPQIILDADMKATGAETPSTHCKFGDLAGPVGSSLTTYDCHISCTCATPPEFTCVRYPTCEVALQAQKAGYIP